MNIIRKVILLAGIILPLHLLHAQTEAVTQAQLAVLEQAEPTPAAAVPASGQFYPASLANRGVFAPIFPPGTGLPAWDLGDGAWLVDDLEPVTPLRKVMQMMSLDGGPMPPGASGGGGGTNSYAFNGFVLDTNLLWLSVSNLTSGLVSLQLHRATNQIYGIYSAASLTVPMADWTPVAELWPTNALVFSVPATGDMRLYRAMDWTGYTVNELPAWWTFFWFGNLSETAADLDGQNNTLGYDYTNNLDPNIIQFSLSVTNQYVSTLIAPVQANVTVGVPGYFAVLVDDTNFAGAGWQAYTSSNIYVNLGLTAGWHDVWVGLKGPAPNASSTWQWKHLNLTLPPVLVITNPTTGTVDEPMIQIYGYCQEPLASISYDLSNAVGVVAGLPSEITDQYYDTNAGGLTTNYFECLDVPLTNGLNTVTIHATDFAGNVTATNFNFTLDYSGKTNPPAVQITWPQIGTQISGGNFTCRGVIDDATAAVTAQVVFTNSNTNLFYGGIYTNVYVASVERNGNFWLENLPLNAGTNTFSIRVKDAVGNTSVTNICVIQSALTFTINPVASDSQLWQPTVNLTGTISSTNSAIWVNGVKGHNNGNGTWSANNVPVSDGGTASFTATAYDPNEQQPDGSYGN